MSSEKRVAVVTGSNKGIGLETVKQLCEQFDGDVILTARSESNGKEAIEKLKAAGLQPKFHQLDITDKSSIGRLRAFLRTTYGGLDVLVNNAAIAYKGDAKEPFSEQAEVSMQVNFWSTLDVCDALFPLLRPHARVVNVSSFVSQMAAKQCSEEMKKRFLSPSLTLADIKQLMTEFVKAAQDGSHKDRGWPGTAYGTTKIGVTLITFVQQAEMEKDSRQDIIINAADPGLVNTDMTGHRGRPVSEGADTSVYLALLPPNSTSPKGKLVANRKVQPWP